MHEDDRTRWSVLACMDWRLIFYGETGRRVRLELLDARSWRIKGRNLSRFDTAARPLSTIEHGGSLAALFFVYQIVLFT